MVYVTVRRLREGNKVGKIPVSGVLMIAMSERWGPKAGMDPVSVGD